LKGVDKDQLTVLEVDVTGKSLTPAPLPIQVRELTLLQKNPQSPAQQANQIMFPIDFHHLRLSFSIPGILYPEKSPSQLDHTQLTHTFAVNTTGPLLLAKQFSLFLLSCLPNAFPWLPNLPTPQTFQIMQYGSTPWAGGTRTEQVKRE
jgi:hypothetical protein